MRKIYESFEELADEMCDGGGVLHAYNCAVHHLGPQSANTCIAWQRGVMTFAAWLDHIGVKVEIPDTAENFYEFCAKKHPGEPDEITEADAGFGALGDACQ